MVNIRDITVIQGGMGVGVSLHKLASAVMREGQMGTISAAHPGFKRKDFYDNSLRANITALKEEIVLAKQQSQQKGMLAVNIMAASRDYESYCKAAVGADAIISGAGLPLKLPEYVAGHPILLAPIVSSAKALEMIVRVWKRRYDRKPDFVVIEGHDAGGHLGFSEKDLKENTCQTNDEILKEIMALEYDIPLFVGGGVFTHEDIKHYQSLGAQGVQIGTRMIATEECDAHPNFKQMIVNAKTEDVIFVKSPTGFCARAIRNAFTDLMEKGKNPVKRCIGCLSMCNPNDTPYCITQALIQAVNGDTENGLFFAGTNADRVNKIVSVHSLLEELL